MKRFNQSNGIGNASQTCVLAFNPLGQQQLCPAFNGIPQAPCAFDPADNYDPHWQGQIAACATPRPIDPQNPHAVEGHATAIPASFTRDDGTGLREIIVPDDGGAYTILPEVNPAPVVEEQPHFEPIPTVDSDLPDANVYLADSPAPTPVAEPVGDIDFDGIPESEEPEIQPIHLTVNVDSTPTYEFGAQAPLQNFAPIQLEPEYQGPFVDPQPAPQQSDSGAGALIALLAVVSVIALSGKGSR